MIKAKKDLKKIFEKMLDPQKNIRVFFKKVTFYQYQEAQLKRWQTENKSEGERWKPLNKEYEKYKRVKYAAYRGAGKAMLVATGNLIDSTIKYPFVVVDNKSIKISPNIGAAPYAKYVNETRNFMSFGEKTIERMKKSLINYIKTGKFKA
jgi:hypothetical protein